LPAETSGVAAGIEVGCAATTSIEAKAANNRPVVNVFIVVQRDICLLGLSGRNVQRCPIYQIFKPYALY
jgi:hypothetical protein